jgi:RNA polymerase sigma-70 factor (ECF subfamily)
MGWSRDASSAARLTKETRMRVSAVGMVASTSRDDDGLPKFASVYEEHFDFVRRIVRRLGVSEASAEDVTQEVFVVVSRRLAEFEERSSLKTWLFGIARNVSYRHRRQVQRRVVTVGEDALDTVPDSRARSAQEIVERREASCVLDALIDTLDDNKRRIFILAELEERPMPEVAEAMGINLNTAYTRLRAARRGLEQQISIAIRHPSFKGATDCAKPGDQIVIPAQVPV